MGIEKYPVIKTEYTAENTRDSKYYSSFNNWGFEIVVHVISYLSSFYLY